VLQTLVLQLLQRVADLVDDGRLDALGRLVEDEELGLGEERAADGELLLLTAGEHAALAGEHLLQHGKERVHALEQRLGFGAAAAVDDQTDLEVFLRR
jgi:hypothetical protein